MAGSGSGTAIKLLLVVGGGWLLATKTNMLCSLGIGASCGAPAAPVLPSTGGPQPGATPGVVTAPVAPTPAAVPIPAYNTLASVYDRLAAITARSDSGLSMAGGLAVATPWQFNWYLNKVTGYDLGPVLGQLFPGCGTGVQGGCDTTPITIAQFWTAAAPYLQQSKGLSGIRSLAGLAARLQGLGCSRFGGCYPDQASRALGMARRTA